MLKSLFTAALAASFLPGCGENLGLRSGGASGKLSDRATAILLEVEEMHRNNSAARDGAPMGFAANEKQQKMAKMIADNCRLADRIPNDQMTGRDNISELKGGAGTCPVYWFRRRTFIPSSRTFIFVDQFKSNSDEYTALGGVSMRNFNGQFQKIPHNDAFREIKGSIKIGNFNVPSIGALGGRIDVFHEYPTGDSGMGMVSLYLSGPGFEVSAVVQVAAPSFKYTFLVNGQPVEEKDFENLFGSYELVKIMDNSLIMR